MRFSRLSIKLLLQQPFVQAILVAIAVLPFMPAGPLSSFVYSLPVIVLFVGWLLRLSASPLLREFLLLLLLTPAAGLLAWRRRLFLLDLPYLRPHDHGEQLIYAAQRLNDTGLPLLVIGVLVIHTHQPQIGRLWACVCGAIAAQKGLILLASSCLAHSHYLVASIAVMIEACVPLICLIIAMTHMFKNTNKLLNGFRWIFAVWFLASPLGATLHKNSFYNTRLPAAQLGGPALWDPILLPISSTDLLIALSQQELMRIPGEGWWCRDKPREDWATAPRATAVFGLMPEQSFVDLSPHLPLIFQHGVTRLSLVGYAEQRVAPPLSRQLQQPAMHLLFSRPPEQALKGQLVGKDINWFTAQPQIADACWIKIDPYIPAQTLFDALQQWQKPCSQHLFVDLGNTTTAWTPPIPCQLKR